MTLPGRRACVLGSQVSASLRQMPRRACRHRSPPGNAPKRSAFSPPDSATSLVSLSLTAVRHINRELQVAANRENTIRISVFELESPRVL